MKKGRKWNLQNRGNYLQIPHIMRHDYPKSTRYSHNSIIGRQPDWKEVHEKDNFPKKIVLVPFLLLQQHIMTKAIKKKVYVSIVSGD